MRKLCSNLQDKGGVLRNETRETTVTVGVVAILRQFWLHSDEMDQHIPSDGKSGLLAEAHTAISTEDTLIPTYKESAC